MISAAGAIVSSPHSIHCHRCFHFHKPRRLSPLCFVYLRPSFYRIQLLTLSSFVFLSLIGSRMGPPLPSPNLRPPARLRPLVAPSPPLPLRPLRSPSLPNGSNLQHRRHLLPQIRPLGPPLNLRRYEPTRIRNSLPARSRSSKNPRAEDFLLERYTVLRMPLLRQSQLHNVLPGPVSEIPTEVAGGVVDYGRAYGGWVFDYDI